VYVLALVIEGFLWSLQPVEFIRNTQNLRKNDKVQPVASTNYISCIRLLAGEVHLLDNLMWVQGDLTY
jgi:hypothetical protein